MFQSNYNAKALAGPVITARPIDEARTSYDVTSKSLRHWSLVMVAERHGKNVWSVMATENATGAVHLAAARFSTPGTAMVAAEAYVTALEGDFWQAIAADESSTTLAHTLEWAV